MTQPREKDTVMRFIFWSFVAVVGIVLKAGVIIAAPFMFKCLDFVFGTDIGVDITWPQAFGFLAGGMICGGAGLGLILLGFNKLGPAGAARFGGIFFGAATLFFLMVPAMVRGGYRFDELTIMMLVLALTCGLGTFVAFARGNQIDYGNT